MFDKTHPPVLRFETRPPDGVRVVIDDGQPVAVTLTHEARPPRHLLRVHPKRPLSAGPGRVLLHQCQRVLHEWPVIFGTECGPTASPRAWALACDAIAEARATADAPVRAWSRAAAAAQSAGVPTERSRALRAAAFHALWRREYRQAQALLDEADEVDRRVGNSFGEARALKYRADVAQATGRYARALELLERARALSHELGRDADARRATQDLALLHTELGRHRDALRLIAEAEPPRDAPTRATQEFQVNLGWTLMSAMTHRALPFDEARPRAAFERALALTEAIGEPSLRANVLTNLAGLAFAAGDHPRAREHIASARLTDPDASGAASDLAELLTAELDLAAGRREAAAARFESLAMAGAEVAWRAMHGRARAARAPAVAARWLRRAVAAVERAGRAVGVTSGRAPFLADRQAPTDDLVALLLEQGQTDLAFAVEDAARAQVLRAVELRGRLQRLGPAPGRRWDARLRTWLTAREEAARIRRRGRLVPAAEATAWAHARQQADARVRRAFDAAQAVLEGDIPLPSATRLTAVREAMGPDRGLLLESGDGAFFLTPTTLRYVPDARSGAWRDAVAGLTHLYIVGELTPTGLGIGVSYLPYAGWLTRPPRETPGRPLVVADPESDLAASKKEGEIVALGLAARLLIGAEATRATVLEALDGTPIFHFTGHGVLRPDAPWAAHLRLHDGERLDLVDVIAARPAVGVVVLNGCETGGNAPIGRRERVGLPEAFLAAGARSVLATRRVVGDAAASAFVSRFFALGGGYQPSRALEQASAEARARGDEIWTAFYLAGRP